MNYKLNDKENFTWFLTGLTDGDGGFSVGIIKSTNSIGWSVRLLYTITAENNKANKIMLEKINLFFNNIGRIIIDNSSNVLRLEIHGLNNCLIIREHFLKYPLFTYKLVYFKLWCLIIDLMLAKKHLTWEGLLQIIAYKSHFPKGLSNLLINSFPNYEPVILPDYTPNLTVINIFWIAGFINSDGGFTLYVCKKETQSLGETCIPSVHISQNIKSKIVLEQIKTFFGFGQIYNRPDQTCDYKISSLTNINNFIANFKEAQLLGAKALDYLEFCLGIEIINKKEHLTKKGLNNLKFLSSQMNYKRTNFDI